MSFLNRCNCLNYDLWDCHDSNFIQPYPTSSKAKVPTILQRDASNNYLCALMIYHIVVGDEAAKPLREAVSAEPSMEGEVVTMHDILHVGPLQKGEGQTFSQLRSAFWQMVSPNEKAPIEVDDTERILEVSAQMHREPDTQAWFWMAPWPADVAAYYWLIKYLTKYPGRFCIVNLANLPFLNEAGKVYYPKNVSEILPRELIKARKLARPVTPSEAELDGDEWIKLVGSGHGNRIHEGGKKLASKGDDYYDAQLLSFCTAQFQKAAKLIYQAMNKTMIPTGDVYLAWRLRQMSAAGQVELKGDSSKPFRDWEVRKPGGENFLQISAESADAAQ